MRCCRCGVLIVGVRVRIRACTFSFLGVEQHKKGEQREREDWEMPFYTLFFGGFVLVGAGLYFKPATSAREWAREEALEREWKKKHNTQ